jgi:hypothetical protein
VESALDDFVGHRETMSLLAVRLAILDRRKSEGIFACQGEHPALESV